MHNKYMSYFSYIHITLIMCLNRSLVVHGFAVDENGAKMSKSIGNVVDPNVVINGGEVGCY